MNEDRDNSPTQINDKFKIDLKDVKTVKENALAQNNTLIDVNQSKITDQGHDFFVWHTWELWVIFLVKLITSLVFLIDDLTFLVFCEYEFKLA